MFGLAEYRLTTPLTREAIGRLDVGDIVYLSGIIYTARDEAHIHILEDLRRGREVKIPPRDGVIYHCGPILRKKDDGGWQVLAAGPTTSSRMNTLEPEFIEKTGIRGIIGKGGMSKPVAEALARHGGVYFSFTGGAAVLAAKGLKTVKGVYYEELGMAEAVWVFEAESFGPLIVGIDAKGNSLFERVSQEVQKSLVTVKQRLGI